MCRMERVRGSRVHGCDDTEKRLYALSGIRCGLSENDTLPDARASTHAAGNGCHRPVLLGWPLRRSSASGAAPFFRVALG